jgi:glycosyltransferase involved in cell wall biosynthesis
VVSSRRLVFFAPSPSEPGGAQRRTTLLAEALAERGWRVLVVGRTAGGARPSVTRAGSVTVFEVPGFGRRRLGASLFLCSSVVAGLVSGGRSHGYLALQLSSPATAAGVCGLLTGRPFVVMSSTSGTLSETSLLCDGFASSARRALLKRAAALVGQTEDAARELQAVFGTTPSAVLPTPVAILDPPSLSGAPRAAFAGRLSEEKDLPRLLRAWETLAAERPDARLTLIGAGSAHRSVEAQLREQAQRSPILRASVTFTGWLADPSAELASSDVFVLPSLSEGMSNALLEACALGRIVVASDIAANRAVLGGDYPLLFRAGDEAALLAALRGALDEVQVRARAQDAIAQRIHLFSPATVAEGLERLLDADRPRNQ